MRPAFVGPLTKRAGSIELTSVIENFMLQKVTLHLSVFSTCSAQ